MMALAAIIIEVIFFISLLQRINAPPIGAWPPIAGAHG
jgi:hypothetical protein